MIAVMKGTLSAVKKGMFTPQDGVNKGRNVDYWTIALQDNMGKILSFGFDFGQGEMMFGSETAQDKFVGKKVLVTCDITKWDGQLKLKGTSIQLAPEK